MVTSLDYGIKLSNTSIDSSDMKSQIISDIIFCEVSHAMSLVPRFIAPI